MIGGLDIVSDEEIEKINARFDERIASLKETLTTLNAIGVYKYNDPALVLGAWSSIIVRIKAISELGPMAAVLHMSLPGIQRQGSVEIWSPYGDLSITQWTYTYKGFSIKVWLETTTEDAPLHLAGPHCSFKKQMREETVLSCEVGSP